MEDAICGPCLPELVRSLLNFGRAVEVEPDTPAVTAVHLVLGAQAEVTPPRQLPLHPAANTRYVRVAVGPAQNHTPVMQAWAAVHT